MNVDVLNRSGLQPPAQSKLAIADCDVHPRPAGAGIGGVSKSLYPYLSKRWQEHVETIGVRYRQPWEKRFGVSEGPAAGLPPRRLAERRESRAATWRFMAEQHLDPNNVALGILNPLTSGQGAQDPRPVGRPDACHQRVAGRRMDVARCAAEGVGGGAVRGRPDLGAG